MVGVHVSACECECGCGCVGGGELQSAKRAHQMVDAKKGVRGCGWVSG